MYVVQSDACTMPNGTIPPSAATVAAAQAALAQAESQISNAQAAFNSVVTRPDMGPVSAVPPSTRANLFRFQNWPQVTLKNADGSKRMQCYPASVKASTLTTMPDAPAMPSLTTSHGVDQPLAPPTTGNPCLDVQVGYALQSQLTPAMLWKCSQAGYFKTGLKPTVASVLALANQKQLPPLPDASVPPYDPSMVAGMGQAADSGASFVLWASLGLGAAVLWLSHEWAKAKRTR